VSFFSLAVGLATGGRFGKLADYSVDSLSIEQEDHLRATFSAVDDEHSIWRLPKYSLEE